MLDVVTMVDPVPEHGDGVRGQDLDHRQSPHGGSASSLTPPEEHGRGRNQDDKDLCDVIHNRDACDQIINRRQVQGHVEHERHEERHYDYYGPFYDQPHQHHSPEGGCNEGRVKAFSHDMKRVCWPLNFKSLRVEKYDGSTNPAEWLKVYQLTIKASNGDSYVMANYLLVYLSASARTWLLGLPTWSERSWPHLCRLFTSNF
jgi:hypothetical protein